jgi:acid phosphatase
MRQQIACAAGLLAVLLSGCAGTPADDRSQVATATSGPLAATVRPTKVLTIVEENHGQTSAVRGMPYLTLLSQHYGRTTAYRTQTHPSLPNYLAMAGGSTFGVRDDGSPAQHPLSGPSVFDAARGTGHTAKTYAEAMTRPCQTSPAGTYAVKHNPWPYFTDAASRRSCQSFDVPSGTITSGALRNDVVRGTLPHVGLLIPDLCHDAHDCSLATADAWLKSWMRVITAGPDYQSGRLVVVITFDEIEGTGTGSILTVVVTPTVRGRTVTSALNHLSWSRWMTDLVGAKPLRQGANAVSLGRAFGL